MNDPYLILGVRKSASIEEIKSAYKKLARKHHPDLNPGKKDSEERFKTLANAYDLIGTPEAKAKYDSGELEVHMQGRGKSRGPTYSDTQDSGGRYSYDYAAGMDDEIFSSLFGKMRHQQRGGELNYPGEDELYKLEVTFQESAVGAEKNVTLPNGKKLEVQIPGGLTTGQKLKFKGQGGAGIGTGPPGDLYIQISVKASEVFKRVGDDIVSEVSVSFFEAMNGSEVEVETVDGKVMLKIPADVTTGTKLRVKGKGAGKKDHRGHHLALIRVVMPKDPPPELKESIAILEKKFHYNPRSQS